MNAMNHEAVKIQFALVSHTNNGKTTLARTLVGMDVGEVRDAAHVTQFAEAHPLQRSAAGDTLVLWDTPGFGDSVRRRASSCVPRPPMASIRRKPCAIPHSTKRALPSPPCCSA